MQNSEEGIFKHGFHPNTAAQKIIADFPSANGVLEGKALKDEMDRLMAQQIQAERSYGAEHPMVLKINVNINKVNRTIKIKATNLLIKGILKSPEKKIGAVQVAVQPVAAIAGARNGAGELQRKQ